MISYTFGFEQAKRFFTLCFCVVVLSISQLVHATDTQRAYVGTYTSGESEGIYLLEFDETTGDISHKGLACKTENPSFLAMHPKLKVVYAVGEMEEGSKVSAFLIAGDAGKLELINRTSSGGPGPCHVTVSSDGKFLAVANYGGGSVSVIALGEDGALGESAAFVQHTGSSVNPRRQEAPHAHAVDFSPCGKFLLSADLGLDQVLIYRMDAVTGALSPHDPPYLEITPGAGPRQIAFSPTGKNLYVVNELANTVSVFAWDAQNASATLLQEIGTLPDDFEGGSHTAEIAVHPSGKFVIASNRGHDSLAVFEVGEQGKLKFSGYGMLPGKTPRHFTLSPDGNWVLAGLQNSGKVAVLKFSPQSGALEDTGNGIEVPNPVCVLFTND